MESVGVKRGLSGKARQTYKRTRASRVHTQQLIEDYLDPEPTTIDLRSERTIPVRHRHESLLPSSPTFEHIAFGDDRQFDLEFNKPEPQAEIAVAFVPGRPRTVQVGVQPTPNESPRPEGGADAGVEGPSPALVAEKSVPAFTIRGFLCGCAIGAAAAAALLMIVQTALR